MHKLEIIINKGFTLEQVEALKELLYVQVMAASEQLGLGIEHDDVDLCVTDL